MANKQISSNNNIYHSMDEIRNRKLALQNDIQDCSKQISILWNNIFRKPTQLKSSSPTQRFLGILSVGASVFDGALLGWKLYKKLKRF